jgi:hypothetical protein
MFVRLDPGGFRLDGAPDRLTGGCATVRALRILQWKAG